MQAAKWCVLLTLLVSAELGCNSTSSQPEGTIGDQMHLTSQLQCNANGNFYDNITAVCMATVTLSKWDCTKAGYQKRNANATSSAQAQRLTVLEGYLKMGYSMAQCGENSLGTDAYVMFEIGKNSQYASSVQAKLALLALTPLATQ